jgi:cob(I)alamin adenosyltransferase
MKIYTRAGDRGETSLLRGGKVRKDDPYIEAYGAIDELNSSLGLVRALWLRSPIDSELEQIQRDLFDVGALLASSGADPRFSGVAPARIDQLEQQIDGMESELPPLTAFILPGGSPEAAQLHVSRTICRRAERRVVKLEETATIAIAMAYLNRLSDFLFVAARYANRIRGFGDTLWK